MTRPRASFLIWLTALACNGEKAKQDQAVAELLEAGREYRSGQRWQFAPIPDRMDDSRVLLLLRPSTTARHGMDKDAPTLAFRCKQGKLTAYVQWAESINSQNPQVMTRVDSAPPKREQWHVGQDHATTIRSGDAQAWLRQLAEADTLAVRVTTVLGERTAVFGLDSLPDSAATAMLACR